MIAVTGLCRCYGAVQALDHVSFQLEPGSTCGLLGANGAGKSTLMKILVGLVVPDSGSLLWEGRPTAFGEMEFRRSTGYVPEEDLLDDYLTVTEFLDFVAAVRGVPPGERRPRVSKWIEFFDLGEKRKALLIECSHGMRRKVSLAAALVARPRLLLLDEAMNGLDPVSRLRLRDELRSFAAAGGTILFSSHVIETIETLCDRVLILSAGRLARDLRAAEWSGGTGADRARSLEAIFIAALHE